MQSVYLSISRTSLFDLNKKFHSTPSLTPLHICLFPQCCSPRIVLWVVSRLGTRRSQAVWWISSSDTLGQTHIAVQDVAWRKQTLLLDAWRSGHLHVTCYVLFDWIYVDQLHVGNLFVAFRSCTADFVAQCLEDVELPFVTSCGVGLAFLV